MFSAEFVYGFLAGTCLSFLVSIFTLDVYYRSCIKQWMDEVIKQYNNKIEDIKNGKI